MKKEEEKMADHSTMLSRSTGKLPKSMWVKLRRLQEKGEIKSIHQACLDRIELIIKERGLAHGKD